MFTFRLAPLLPPLVFVTCTIVHGGVGGGVEKLQVARSMRKISRLPSAFVPTWSRSESHATVAAFAWLRSGNEFAPKPPPFEKVSCSTEFAGAPPAAFMCQM